MVNPRKKKSVDSKLARGRVSKFYWWVIIRSRVWGLVSLILEERPLTRDVDVKESSSKISQEIHTNRNISNQVLRELLGTKP